MIETALIGVFTHLPSRWDHKSFCEDYKFNYKTMDDNTANNLAERALTLYKNKLDLLHNYYEKIKKATSPVIAARFLQVEYRISLLLDADIASQMPLTTKQQ